MYGDSEQLERACEESQREAGSSHAKKKWSALLAYPHFAQERALKITLLSEEIIAKSSSWKRSDGRGHDTRKRGKLPCTEARCRAARRRTRLMDSVCQLRTSPSGFTRAGPEAIGRSV